MLGKRIKHNKKFDNRKNKISIKRKRKIWYNFDGTILFSKCVLILCNYFYGSSIYNCPSYLHEFPEKLHSLYDYFSQHHYRPLVELHVLPSQRYLFCLKNTHWQWLNLVLIFNNEKQKNFTSYIFLLVGLLFWDSCRLTHNCRKSHREILCTLNQVFSNCNILGNSSTISQPR